MRNHPTKAKEQGSALVLVLSLGLIAMLLVTGLMVFASTSTPLARNDQDWNGALTAAESGLDDYLYRLSKDSNYWQKSTDSGNPALAATGAGAPIPGEASSGTFRYTRRTPAETLNGTIKLSVTGLVNDSKRTVEATLRRDGFLDYLYFSKYETVDPDTYSTTGNPSKAWALANCKGRYYYEFGTPGQPGHTLPRVTSGSPRCSEIRWVTGDIVDGPLHTDDAMRIAGNPVFKKKVTTSWPKTTLNRWVPDGSGSYNPDFQHPDNRAGAQNAPNNDNPNIATRIIPPEDNEELLDYAEAEGCVYVGPTWIKLRPGSGALKRAWDVVSPGTAYTPACGGGMTGTTPNVTTNVTGPATFNGVIYVKKATAACTYPVHPKSGQAYPPGLPVPIAEPGYTPLPSGLAPWNMRDINTYDCLEGDAFVEGTLDGQLTIGAQNNIVITKNIRYYEDPATVSTSDDILGLITINFIDVLHPVRCTNCTSATNPSVGSRAYQNITGYWDSTIPLADRDPLIHAAMLSTQHSFKVQHWDKGVPPGSSAHLLRVRGAIAQIYRGPVGTGGGSTGYLKDYRYDDRLKLIAPPHFLDPVQSAWKVKTWAEIKPK